MIFVTVGSQKFPFERLLKKVDRLIQSRVITEEVLMQTGISDYVPSCPYQAFYERDAFAGHLERCDVLITHGGAGTMVRAVRQGKKTIVVPRLARYAAREGNPLYPVPVLMDAGELARFYEGLFEESV